MTQPNKSKRKIMRGYDKLAFGGISDAVWLMCCDDPNVLEIRKLDLFNVAEIKRPKGGGMEIKFFDRIKAMQCLEQLSDDREQGVGDFYRALEQSVGCFQADSSEGD